MVSKHTLSALLPSQYLPNMGSREIILKRVLRETFNLIDSWCLTPASYTWHKSHHISHTIIVSQHRSLFFGETLSQCRVLYGTVIKRRENKCQLCHHPLSKQINLTQKEGQQIREIKECRFFPLHSLLGLPQTKERNLTHHRLVINSIHSIQRSAETPHHKHISLYVARDLLEGLAYLLPLELRFHPCPFQQSFSQDLMAEMLRRPKHRHLQLIFQRCSQRLPPILTI